MNFRFSPCRRRRRRRQHHREPRRPEGRAVDGLGESVIEQLSGRARGADHDDFVVNQGESNSAALQRGAQPAGCALPPALQRLAARRSRAQHSRHADRPRNWTQAVSRLRGCTLRDSLVKFEISRRSRPENANCARLICISAGDSGWSTYESAKAKFMRSAGSVCASPELADSSAVNLPRRLINSHNFASLRPSPPGMIDPSERAGGWRARQKPP